MVNLTELIKELREKSGAGFLDCKKSLEENENKMSCIEFIRIKGGKPFDVNIDWYTKMLKEIKQI